MTDLLNAALAYAEHGWPVFPCRITKSPLTSEGFKDASTNAGTIDLWWHHYPLASIGIPTGKVSGFIVLDVDPDHGGGES